MGNRSPAKYRREGGRAFDDGYSLADNPYHTKSSNFDNWNDGWKQACANEDSELKEKDAEKELHESIMSEIDVGYNEPSTVSNLVKLLIERGILT